MEHLNFGILGTGNIINNALIAPSKNTPINLYGVASSSAYRAQKIANKYNIRHHSNYAGLINDENIDALYIALSNEKHTKWAIKGLESGKHILLEKPLCLSYEDAIKIKTSLIAKSKIYLLEGIMVQHHPWQDVIKRLVSSKKHGILRKIETFFTFNLGNYNYKKSYKFNPKKGGGCFYDNAPYWSQILQQFTRLKPTKIKIDNCSKAGIGYIENIDVSVEFANGLISKFSSSYNKEYNASHYFFFDKALIKVRNFTRPCFGNQKLILEVIVGNEKQRIIFSPENYYANQLNHFLKVIKNQERPIPIEQSIERIEFFEKILRYCN